MLDYRPYLEALFDMSCWWQGCRSEQENPSESEFCAFHNHKLEEFNEEYEAAISAA